MTVSPIATFKTFYAKPAQKRYRYLRRDLKSYCCKRSGTWQLPISQSHWFLPLLGNKPKKFNFVHKTRRHTLAGHQNMPWHTKHTTIIKSTSSNHWLHAPLVRPLLIKLMFLVRELSYNQCGREVFIIHYGDVTKTCFSTRSENSEPTFSS